MNDPMMLMAIFLGVLSVTNKLLFLSGHSSGWTTGMLIGIISAFYFWYIGLEILALAEIGFFFVMTHGLVLSKRWKERQNLLKYDRRFRAALAVFLVVISIVLFRGNITVLELVSSNSFLWGGFAYANAKKLIGWLLWICAHATTAIASVLVGEVLFAILQGCSGLVCIYAVLTIVVSCRSPEQSEHTEN